GVVEKPVDAVAVVLIILRRVDAALGGNAVGAARTVLDAEVEDLIPELAKRCGGRSAGQSGADDDHRELPLVGGIDQLHRELVPVPLVGERARGNVAVERHRATSPTCRT